MTQSPGTASPIHHETQFDAFLFAEIGEDQNGMALTVLSALARQDVDPWGAAAELLRLSPLNARCRLASLLEILPAARSINLQSGAIERLISLLPAQPNARFLHEADGAGPRANPKTLIGCILLVAIIIGAQQFWQNERLRSQDRNLQSSPANAALSSMPNSTPNP